MTSIANSWTEEETEILRRLWCVEGKSSAYIAKVLGKTKGAVIGRAARDFPEFKRLNKGFKSNKFAKKKEDLDIIGSGNDFTLTGCHFPFGDVRKKNHRYCNGEKVKGQVYCEEHCILSYPNWNKELSCKEETY